MSDAPQVAQRITVSLTPRAAAELQQLHFDTGTSKTDLINRAISLYAAVDEWLSSGSSLLVRSPNGEIDRVTLL